MPLDYGFPSGFNTRLVGWPLEGKGAMHEALDARQDIVATPDTGPGTIVSMEANVFEASL